ncbi:MAG: hypothetical protein O3C47_09040 [Bacteroidetes bacterium]|nr:hypothetical protein [Bacteroidota bacterium]
MKKNYLTLVVIIMTTTLFAQNRKEQIAKLTSQIDSLNSMVLKDRTSNDSLVRVLNTDINVKKQEIQSLNTTLAENQKLVSIKDSEILLLQEKMKWALDSMNVLVQMLEPKKDSISSISIAAFRQVNRNNINKFDIESFMGVFQGLETRNYVEAKYLTNSDKLAEEAYFEMLLDSKVVVRGYVLSGCGDGYTYAINFYTLDGFLYQTKFANGVVEYQSYWEIITYYGSDAFYEYGGQSSFFDNRPSDSDKKLIINKLKSVPKTFKLTKTKPEIMDCVYIEGFTFE